VNANALRLFRTEDRREVVERPHQVIRVDDQTTGRYRYSYNPTLRIERHSTAEDRFILDAEGPGQHVTIDIDRDTFLALIDAMRLYAGGEALTIPTSPAVPSLAEDAGQ